jgi:hypothetical protein
MKIKPGTPLKNGVPGVSVMLIISTNQYFTDRAQSKPALLKKGLLRGESLLGPPEGAKAPEGSPTILMGRRPERSEGCTACARQDRWGGKGLGLETFFFKKGSAHAETCPI